MTGGRGYSLLLVVCAYCCSFLVINCLLILVIINCCYHDDRVSRQTGVVSLKWTSIRTLMCPTCTHWGT